MTVAITGGIGCGKTYIGKLLLERYNIDVYNCDTEAKNIVLSKKIVQKKISRLIGEDVFADGKIDKETISKFIFASEANRNAINKIVHPLVAKDFWMSKKTWIETAMLYDSGFFHLIKPDKVVSVTAPLELRVERIMERDGISMGQAFTIINNQMPQDRVERYADYIISCDEGANIDKQLRLLVDDIEYYREIKMNK